MQTNPEHYKWGIFYYNKEDKRIIVPKRIKWMGWTLNFAHPLTFLILAILLLLLFLIDFGVNY